MVGVVGCGEGWGGWFFQQCPTPPVHPPHVCSVWESREGRQAGKQQNASGGLPPVSGKGAGWQVVGRRVSAKGEEPTLPVTCSTCPACPVCSFLLSGGLGRR